MGEPKPQMDWEQASRWREQLRAEGRSLVFTNGCFDLLHAGHVELLTRCRELGDTLVVGLNSDTSVARLKGPSRPIVPEQDRAAVLAGLRAVDAVVLFEQDTPAELIELLKPDVLAKGGDWAPEQVVGAEQVQQAGGRVEIIPLLSGRSTTNLVERVLEKQQSDERLSEDE